jgi:asparagine synthase (glutamine-hydrolysing)
MGVRVIVFNGELYNFRELRARHGARRRRIPNVQRYRGSYWRRCNGWRTDARSRDWMRCSPLATTTSRRANCCSRATSFGEKPLYYIDTPEYLAFASELHALTCCRSFDATMSTDAIASYLCFQYVPAPQAIYTSVRKLQPGIGLRWVTTDLRTWVATFHSRPAGAQTSGRDLDDLAR